MSVEIGQGNVKIVHSKKLNRICIEGSLGEIASPLKETGTSRPNHNPPRVRGGRG